MERHWLLTNTCYGNWLPGDARGFVGHVQEHRSDDSLEEARVVHNVIGTPYDCTAVGLKRASAALLKGPPIHLTADQASVFVRQVLKTATFRGWRLRAVAVMFNHFHIVVCVMGDSNPSKVLGDFKSWGTRALSQRFGGPKSGTWWTERGSKRKLPHDRAIAAAIRYVLYRQPRPLVNWSPETGLHYGVPPQRR